MKQSTVVLGPFSNEPLAQGLHALLSRSGNFRVITVDNLDNLDIILAGLGAEPATMIMEGNDPSICRRYLERDFVRTVVLIDTAAALAFVGVDNPRWEELADVVRAVVNDAETRWPEHEDDRVRIVGTEMLVPDGCHRGHAEGDGLEPLMEWLELCLAWRLSQRGVDVGPGVLGWSVTPHQALGMLGVDSSGGIDRAHQEDLEARLKTCESDLFVTGRTLPRAIAHIRDVFDLSSEELRFLGVVLAPEIDGRYATAIGVLQDDLTRRRPSLTLMAELDSEAGLTTWGLRRSLNGPDSLVAKGLVRAEPEGLAVDAALVPSAAVVAYLLATSPELAAAVIGAELRSPTACPEPPLSPQEESLVRQLLLADHDSGPARVVGGDRSKRWFGRLADGMGLTLLVGDFQALEPGVDRGTAAGEWSILSRVVECALLLLGTDTLTPTERARIAEPSLLSGNDGRLVVADGDLSEQRRGSGVVVKPPVLSAAQRSDWWTAAARQAGLILGEGDPARLAATVNLDPGDFASAVAMAVRQTAAGVDGTLVELVQRSARDMASCELPAGVRRIEPVYGWNDIVVGDENRTLLESIAHHVLYEGQVMEEWGFAERVAHGRGVAALFSGPSGTGKTMAAQIIAKDLGVDLMQVDLSKTVSKYIGDTEKNLDKVFQAAECTGSVLLFDEADAIFGRRTEIKDAHDRHANVEVAYLLQRLESFRGLTILTTNLKQNIDNAFARRLRFVIDFALPTAAERVKIWHRAFPAGVLADGAADITTIAGRLPIAGGSIQNIALHAAFLAAPDGGPIDAGHLVAAIRRELLKMGMRSAMSGLDDLLPLRVGADGHDQRIAP